MLYEVQILHSQYILYLLVSVVQSLQNYLICNPWVSEPISKLLFVHEFCKSIPLINACRPFHTSSMKFESWLLLINCKMSDFFSLNTITCFRWHFTCCSFFSMFSGLSFHASCQSTIVLFFICSIFMYIYKCSIGKKKHI